MSRSFHLWVVSWNREEKRKKTHKSFSLFYATEDNLELCCDMTFVEQWGRKMKILKEKLFSRLKREIHSSSLKLEDDVESWK